MSKKPAKIPIREYYNLLATYLRPHWRAVVILSFLIFGNIAGQLLNPQIMRSFLDTATSGGNIEILIWLAIAYIGAAIVQQIFSVGATYVGENLGWTATNELRRDLVAHCLDLDLSFHKLHTPGEMIERIGEDVNALANFFSQFSIKVTGNLLIVIGVLVLLYRENIWVGLIMSLFVVLTLTTIQFFRERSMPFQWRARQASAELSGFVEERLNGTEDIRSNGSVAHVMRGLFQYMRNRNDKQIVANLRATRIRMAAVGLHYLGISIALILGIILITHGKGSIGTIYLFVLYTDLIYRPIMQITRQIEDFQQAGAGIQRIQEIYRQNTEIIDGNGSTLPEGSLPMKLNRVSFSYSTDDDPVLQNISLNLKAGETLGLLGRTGSGKTTLTRLLTRLYNYNSGSIYIGDIELKETQIQDIRKKIGLVTQDVQLFHASVRDNITFFNPDLPDETIKNVLSELGLSNWLNSLPDGLDTILTGGQGLSAGESQLLAFSRVFLRNPGLVIMDEASSRLDPATEHLMEQAMDKLLAHRTGIIVAHRLSTILKVDQIMILENGLVKEYGPRQTLAKDPNSLFSQLLKTGLEEVLA